MKGIVQIHHGYCEHADRYEHFASYLLNQGYVVVVSDFVGHGQSLIDFEQGFFGMDNGSDGIVEDMHHLFEVIRSTYSEAPYYLCGIDLGALFIRKFMSIYGDCIQGVILLGTSGRISKINLVKYEILIMKMFKGPMYKSKKIFNHFHYQNSKKTNGSKVLSWLTNDDEERKMYLDDPMTHFIYTLKGYEDIITTLKQVNSNEYINKIPKELAVFIGVGEEDSMTKNSHELYEKYKEHGIYDLTYEVFEGCKHAVLFEKNKRVVYKKIVDWLNERTYI
jgi:alpha-beta hydrolase superfamily lysophospholipase